ncbi:hypothetical protein D910_08009, partial [Dendroctonus ponderosae]
SHVVGAPFSNVDLSFDKENDILLGFFYVLRSKIYMGKTLLLPNWKNGNILLQTRPKVAMSLRDFCKSLQQCAEKLEQEVKYNINEAHNLFFAKAMDETRLAVEKAKDYHYGEIVKALNQILENVKSLLSHQDKIEWLSNEANFSSSDLKKCKKGPVSASPKSEQKPAFSRSVENIPQNTKRDRRKTVSEVSAQTLEAWEKYLDQKESDETEVLEIATRTQNTVPRRTLSNARARKKFVSSTMGGFLDDNGRLARSLDSIMEKSQNDEEIYRSTLNTISSDKQENIDEKADCTASCETFNNCAVVDDPQDESRTTSIDPALSTHGNSVSKAGEGETSTSIYLKGGRSDTLDLVERINKSNIQKEDIITEFMKDFGDSAESEIGPRQEDPIALKPKIVDVIVS